MYRTRFTCGTYKSRLPEELTRCPCCERMVDNIEPAKMIYVELRGLTYAIKAELSMPTCIDCFAELMFVYSNEMCSKEFKEEVMQ